MKNGRCSLFHKGILQLSWKEVNGVSANFHYASLELKSVIDKKK